MDSCVFCDFSKIASNTIASVRGFNITATLGQITDGGYLLIMPMEHIACLGDFSEEKMAWLKKIVGQVGQAMGEEYGEGLTIFEHGIVGQTIPHAHLHLLPASIDMTERILNDFPETKIEIVTGLYNLRRRYQHLKTPYLLWTDPKGYFRVCWNPPAPPMYLRLIAAEMLGVPERGNWRDMPKEVDFSLREETIDRMTPYFLP